jgi:hypothetical protein
MENMNPDMTPYRMFLDVSISPKNKNRKMYNKYKILIIVLYFKFFIFLKRNNFPENCKKKKYLT